jgi:hypothetical protein
VEKLVDALGTKYFAAHWSRDVTEYLENHGEADIADARFVKTVSDTLGILQRKGVLLVDSMNNYRNKLLEENRRRLAEPDIKDCLPPLVKYQDLPDYLDSLESGSKFCAREGDILQFLLGIVVQVYRPDVTIDFTTHYISLFEYIRMYIRWIKQHKKLYMLVGGTYSIVEVEDMLIYIPFEGKVRYNEAIMSHPLIPCDFGNIKLDAEPEWSMLIDRVLLDLEDHMEVNRKTMKDYCLTEDV